MRTPEDSSRESYSGISEVIPTKQLAMYLLSRESVLEEGLDLLAGVQVEGKSTKWKEEFFVCLVLKL